MKPDLFHPYNNRGNAYSQKGKYEFAIKDYDKAIQLKPDLAEAHYNRGIAWLIQQKWKKAKSDLTAVRELQENIIIEEFSKNYGSVSDFEEEHGVKLPEDIAAMLTPP